MRTEFPMNDPRNIWKNQPTEGFKMSVDELHRKAQQRQKKARFEALFSIIIGLMLFVLFACAFVRRPQEMVPRIGWGLMSLWCLYFAYQAYKWIWPRRLAPNGTLNTTLHSYRSELEKRRDYGRHIWRRAGLTFCFLGLAMIILPELIKSLNDLRLLLNVAPVLLLLALWFATFVFVRRRKQGKLQQEIEELRALETENRA